MKEVKSRMMSSAMTRTVKRSSMKRQMRRNTLKVKRSRTLVRTMANTVSRTIQTSKVLNGTMLTRLHLNLILVTNTIKHVKTLKHVLPMQPKKPKSNNNRGNNSTPMVKDPNRASNTSNNTPKPSNTRLTPNQSLRNVSQTC